MHETRDNTTGLNVISPIMKQDTAFYLTKFDRNSLFKILVNGIYSSIFKKRSYWIELIKRNVFKSISYKKLGADGLFIAKK